MNTHQKLADAATELIDLKCTGLIETYSEEKEFSLHIHLKKSNLKTHNKVIKVVSRHLGKYKLKDVKFGNPIVITLLH